jgi:hypothetical protein
MTEPVMIGAVETTAADRLLAFSSEVRTDLMDRALAVAERIEETAKARLEVEPEAVLWVLIHDTMQHHARILRGELPLEPGKDLSGLIAQIDVTQLIADQA